ncbi:hypothetical protein [Nocardioides stalactiti]|uniref:hypothetical protein n=1 Tax=Nocardioides stalactiti TaxID=2755356 RepID=UPI0015FF2206|nr:hypothetical protein [Nocardioides stalactiti]
MPTVIQRGFDSSGRAIKASVAFWTAWDDACEALGFTPTIVQGGWVGDGGASASADTHDGDALDLRLWDRTEDERRQMVRTLRSHGFAYWERYESQGFDLHAHLVPGPWAHPSPGALRQWQAYLDSRDGLAGNAADYHWRPDPIVTEPPEEDPMADYAEQLDRIEKKVADLAAAEVERDKADKDRERRLFANLRVILKERFGSTDAELDEILGHLEP